MAFCFLVVFLVGRLYFFLKEDQAMKVFWILLSMLFLIFAFSLFFGRIPQISEFREQYSIVLLSASLYTFLIGFQ